MNQEIALAEMLYSQGFGTRRVCAGLVQQGLVEVGGEVQTDAAQVLTVYTGMPFRVQDTNWEYHPKAYVMLHKPAGYECSQKPTAWPPVYTLLPSPLRTRPSTGKQAGVQAVGRLDQDTTGLLILTDDGQQLHRMSSPKHHVPKIYQVTCKHPLEPSQIQRLLDGVVLDDDPKPVRAAACVQTAECSLDLTLTQGKYHQVKRMIAAVGNRVEALHRSQIGDLVLPPDLAAGHWRFLTAEQLAALQKRAD